MGALVNLACQECEFASGVMALGGGFFNCQYHLGAPALCGQCRALVLDNYLEPADSCPGCGATGSLRFYDHPDLFRPPDPATEPQPPARVPSSEWGTHAFLVTLDGLPDWRKVSREEYVTAAWKRREQGPRPEAVLAAAARALKDDTVPAAFTWRIGHTEAQFRLPADHLLCPACDRFTMRAFDAGCWD